jgi:methionyl-tRNA formyltransferase
MRLIMMGTGPFAVPTFRALYQRGHELLALVTQPVRPAKGDRGPPPNPMRSVAQEHGTPILDPESVNTPEARSMLAALEPELFIVADYGQILSPETLAVTRRGGINLHGSLLPKYRGAAPINWAIYHGERETGVSVIHMTPQIDAGPLLAQASLLIDRCENAVQLETRLAELGAPLVAETIERLARGEATSLVQDKSLASPARRLRKTDGEIAWSRSAVAISNQVRALEPWPRTSTFWHRAKGPPLRLILGRVSDLLSAADQSAGVAPETISPGTVVAADASGLLVATGQGLLRIDELQPAGKRMLSAADFLRGYPVAPGDRLGPQEPV